MSRLQAGALAVFPQPIALDEVVPAALDDLGPARPGRASTSPPTCPRSRADPACWSA